MKWIQTDTDPAFYLNADPDPTSGSQTPYADQNPDPDSGQTMPSLYVEFFHEKYTFCRFEKKVKKHTYAGTKAF